MSEDKPNVLVALARLTNQPTQPQAPSVPAVDPRAAARDVVGKLTQEISTAQSHLALFSKIAEQLDQANETIAQKEDLLKEARSYRAEAEGRHAALLREKEALNERIAAIEAQRAADLETYTAREQHYSSLEARLAAVESMPPLPEIPAAYNPQEDKWLAERLAAIEARPVQQVIVPAPEPVAPAQPAEMEIKVQRRSDSRIQNATLNGMTYDFVRGGDDNVHTIRVRPAVP